jgi:hypothetical protein
MMEFEEPEYEEFDEEHNELGELNSIGQWIRHDPFREAEVPIEQKNLEQALVSAFQAWKRLPLPLQRRTWREREIAARLYAESRDWIALPGIRSISVGIRRGERGRELTGIVLFESGLPVDVPFENEDYGIPEFVRIPSRVPDTNDRVPVKIEYRPPSSMLGLGLVRPGQFIAASDVLPMPVSVPTLQAGQIIAGESPVGLRKPGTLAAIISREGDDTPLILSAAHVLGQVGWKVVAYVPMPVEIGKVISADHNLDAAIAEISEPWMIDYRVRDMNLVPAAPIFPFSDMPVQFVGGTSGHQQGWIHSVNSIPVGGKAAGVIPHFTSDIRSQPGDSGALLITSHGQASPFPAAFARTMHPNYLEATTCAMLGILVAGPSSTMSPATRPLTYITPILTVLDDFKMQAWVRST